MRRDCLRYHISKWLVAQRLFKLYSKNGQELLFKITLTILVIVM